MADYLSRAFRLQLTTAMESVIRTAVFEITQIFENSLHDHQLELAHKGEEIAHLKVKLQRAEIRLREISGDRGADAIKYQTKQTQKESEASAPQQSSKVPEIDFEVPDDWCVPLGSENVTKQDNFCPSVRLRQFSIPLWPISIKHEDYHKIEEPRLKRRVRKDRKGIKRKTPDKRSQRIVLRSHRQVVNNKVKDVLMDIKKECSEMKVEQSMQRKGSLGKEQETRKVITTKSDVTKVKTTKNTYRCRLCPKVFNTEFGLSVHDRSHKKCRSCKRVFPFPSLLRQHKVRCAEYIKQMADKPSSLSPTKSVPKENSSSIKKVSKKDKSSLKQSTKLVKKQAKKFTCTKCKKKFPLYVQLEKHTCIYTCELCPRTFTTRISLKIHTSKMHKELTEKSLDLSWTKPLEEIEDSQENGLSAGVSVVPKIKECPGGFKCMYCMQIYTSKYNAVEHSYTHTGERPFKCGYCAAAFSHRSTRSIHRRKQHGVQEKKYILCPCGKRFAIKSRYKNHKLNCRKAGKPKKKAS